MDRTFENCFVCGNIQEDMKVNTRVNLPVCPLCSGSEKEKKSIEELLEGLAEGFVCGCI
jgi:hypothetical protein